MVKLNLYGYGKWSIAESRLRRNYNGHWKTKQTWVKASENVREIGEGFYEKIFHCNGHF